jgi:sigma-B regulation protein RsbU (phosphoserine phosphatase)
MRYIENGEQEQHTIGVLYLDSRERGALRSATVQAALETLSVEAYYQTGSASPITRVNAGLFRRAIEARFLTAFYGILHKDGSLVFTNAGHNPPILVKKNSILRLEAGGVVLGLFETATFEQEKVMLEKGDVLLAFSDGVTEAMNEASEEFGDEQLVALMRNRHGQDPRKILKELVEEVKKFTGEALQSDDVTMMAVRYEG